MTTVWGVCRGAFSEDTSICSQAPDGSVRGHSVGAAGGGGAVMDAAAGEASGVGGWTGVIMTLTATLRQHNSTTMTPTDSWDCETDTQGRGRVAPRPGEHLAELIKGV